MLLGCIMDIVSVCTLVESMRTRCNKWCPENQQISQLRVPCQGPPLSSKTGLFRISRGIWETGASGIQGVGSRRSVLYLSGAPAVEHSVSAPTVALILHPGMLSSLSSFISPCVAASHGY